MGAMTTTEITTASLRKTYPAAGIPAKMDTATASRLASAYTAWLATPDDTRAGQLVRLMQTITDNWKASR